MFACGTADDTAAGDIRFSGHKLVEPSAAHQSPMEFLTFVDAEVHPVRELLVRRLGTRQEHIDGVHLTPRVCLVESEAEGDAGPLSLAFLVCLGSGVADERDKRFIPVLLGLGSLGMRRHDDIMLPDFMVVPENLYAFRVLKNSAGPSRG